jgi:gliding motility-associated-like protein
MKEIYIKFALLILMSLNFESLKAQTFVTGLSPTAYIDSLIAGESICFSNVQFAGDPAAIGYFELNNDDSLLLGFNKGIVMTTGTVSEVFSNLEDDPGLGGPPQNPGGLTNLPELTNAVPPSCTGVNDGVFLSFDFVPQSSSVQFKYVFASDEYDEFICSIWNDAFAFLISSPLIGVEQNLAVTANGDPITISTVHNSFQPPPLQAGCIQNNIASIDFNTLANSTNIDVQFDGFTKVLIAQADNLIPCQTYTLKLMIADYCDHLYSSGVFLAANSFSGGPVQSSTNFPAGVTNNTIYESCEPVAITFTKAPSPIESVIPITLLGTATPGEDFDQLVDTLVFPPFTETYDVIIDAYNDDNPNEGVETIFLEYQKYCGCNIKDTVKIFLQDRPVVVSNAGPDVTTCSNEPVQIGTAPLPNYTYDWDPAYGLSDDSIPQPDANIANIGSGELVSFPYVLESKIAGCSEFDTLLVFVKPQPITYFQPPDAQCFEGNSFDFTSNGIFSSNSPSFIWDFGPYATPQSSVENNPQNIQFLGTGPQDITLLAIEDGCESEVFENTVMVHPNPVANFSLSASVQCSPAYVTFTDLSIDANPLQYSWDFGNNTTSTEQNPLITFSESGNYTVKLEVKNIFGCVNTFEIPSLVEIEPTPVSDFVVYPSNILTIEDPTADLSNFGENADVCYYVISSATGIADTIYNFDISYTFPDSGTYKVEQFLLNNNGCSDSTIQTIRVDAGFKIFIPTGFSPDGDGMNDYFAAFGEDIVEAEIIIYNRWGNVLFRSYDPQAGWDGRTRNGEDYVLPGIYFYEYKLRDKYGGIHNKKGTLSVFRN